MNGLSRILLAVAIAVAVVALFGLKGRAQASREKAQRPGLALLQVEEKARAVRKDDPKSVRAFTDEVFDQSPFRDAPKSVRERIFKSELAYRAGAQAEVSEDEFVAALNEQLRPLQALSAARAQQMRTTTGQVHQFRQIMKQYVPNLSHVSPQEPPSGRVEPTMSPSEIVFVAMHLINQKLVNPDYIESPEEWEAKVVARRSQSKRSQTSEGSTKTVSRFQLGNKQASEAGEVLSTVKVQLKDESSAVVQGVHAFLDRLNLQR